MELRHADQLQTLGRKLALEAMRRYVSLGMSVHWLNPAKKSPIEDKWSSVPKKTVEDLVATYRAGANIGFRPGVHSHHGDRCLYVLDVDIKDADYKDECLTARDKLIGRAVARRMSKVVSGSGGHSHHLFFWSDGAFTGKKLWRSADFLHDPETGAPTKKRAAEIQLLAAGSNVVLPPSIHPDTGRAYESVGNIKIEDAEFIDREIVAGWGADEASSAPTSDFERQVQEQPIDITEDEALRYIARLDDDRAVDYDNWLETLAAIHHQFEGSKRGLEIAHEFSKRGGDAYDALSVEDKWRSFGRQSSKPRSFRSLIADANVDTVNNIAPDLQVEDWDDPLAEPSTELVALENELFGIESDPELIALEAEIFGEPADRSIPEGQPYVPFLEYPAPAKEWKSDLTLNSEGGVKNLAANVRLILDNDRRTAGVLWFNEFRGKVVRRMKPRKGVPETRSRPDPIQLDGRKYGHWFVKDPINGDLLDDGHHAQLKELIAPKKGRGGYDFTITSDSLKDGVMLSGLTRKFHPVREYLDYIAEEWDGVPRLDTFFIRHLKFDENRYHLDISTLTFLSLVARIYEPGAKYDQVLVLEGEQGCRKSTFVQKLAVNEHWFTELEGDFDDTNKMVEKMSGKIVAEIPELHGFSRSDIRALKAFFSRQVDIGRLAYARESYEMPRQIIFIGTTNDDVYLRDLTGGRRFWPGKLGLAHGEKIDIDAVESEINMVYAEAVHRYRAIRKAQPTGWLPLHLTNKEAQQTALDLQESRREELVEETMAGKIAAWLDEPVKDDLGFVDAGLPIYREYTCHMEIAELCLGRDTTKMSQPDWYIIRNAMGNVGGWKRANGLRSFPSYGRQRYYERIR